MFLKPGQGLTSSAPSSHDRSQPFIQSHLIRLGRANWKKLSEYHRRSRVEAKMRCLKLLGERIMARDFDRQDAEVQIRIALMNRFTSLGTPQTVRMRWHKPGKRYLRSQSE